MVLTPKEHSSGNTRRFGRMSKRGNVYLRTLLIHGAAGGGMDAYADKLVRDGIIRSHLAGDATQRLKVVRRLPG